MLRCNSNTSQTGFIRENSTNFLKKNWFHQCHFGFTLICVQTSIFFYLRWNLPKIASVVEFALPTGLFFITSPRELIVFLIRILWNQSTGTNSREMVSSAWSLLIACFQNFFVKALSKKTSWTWWSCLVWLQSSRHHLCLTWSILYHVNWGPHRKSFVKWSHHPLILVLCMSTSSMVLFRMVFSRALSQGRRLRQPGMNHHTCKNSTRMEPGLF